MSAANTPPPFEAYRGNEPFVFISYAHKDSEVVFAELSRLTSWGFKIWYDEGIEAGNEWPKEIAAAISKSSLFLYYVSARSVGSVHCRNEVYHALSLNKPFLCIHLEETDLIKLDEGLALSIGRLQAIHKHVLSDIIYQNKLKRSLQTLLGMPEERPAAQPMPQPAVPLPQVPQPLPQTPRLVSQPSPPSRPIKPVGKISAMTGLGLTAVLVILVVIGGLGGLTLFLKHPTKTTSTTPSTNTTILPIDTVPTTTTDTATPTAAPIVTTTTDPTALPNLTTNSDAPTKVDVNPFTSFTPKNSTNTDTPTVTPAQ